MAQAAIQLRQGADVLDLGAQSTRPGAGEVGAEEELRRLLPPLRRIRERFQDALISVDTFLAPVAEAALDAGADWVNDISAGRRDPGMLPLIAAAGCPVVLMHSRGNSRTMDQLTNYTDVEQEVREGLEERTESALKAGISVDQIIWDPGLGFAKTAEQNLQLLKGLERLSPEGIPLLVGPSANGSSVRCSMNRNQSSHLGNSSCGMPLQPGRCRRAARARRRTDATDPAHGGHTLVVA